MMRKDQSNIRKWSASVKTPCSAGRRLCCIVLAVLIAVSNLCLPAFAEFGSDYCDHSYEVYTNTVHNEEFQTDHCIKCGYIRIHRCEYPLRFVIVSETYFYKRPRKSSACKVVTNSVGLDVNVVGRTRNEEGELWLLLDNDRFIPADVAAFDFAYHAEDAVKSVSSVTPLPKFAGMIKTFIPGGSYDMKKEELLGNTYYYRVYCLGKLLSGEYTGEQIGNMMYGYASAAKGYGLHEAMVYAELAQERKDPPEDKFSILLGYTYRKDGAWFEDVSSQYIGKTVAIKSVEVGKYVSSNTDQDVKGINAVADRDSADKWEQFTVDKGEAGAAGFRAKGNGNYLAVRLDEKKEDAYVQAAFGHDYSAPQSWESFYIVEWGGDQYILSQANWKWVQVSVSESDRPIKACADAPSTWERFRLETVDSGSAGSGSTTGGTNGGSTGTPTGGGTAPTVPTATTVSQHYWGSDYNEGQYEGEWSNGKPNGKGKLTYDDFDDGRYYSIVMYGVEYKALYYEGDFRDGWRDGTGKVVYEGGWIQEGTFYGVWTAGKKIFEGKLRNEETGYCLEGYQTATDGLGAEWTPV